MPYGSIFNAYNMKNIPNYDEELGLEMAMHGSGVFTPVLREIHFWNLLK